MGQRESKRLEGTWEVGKGHWKAIAVSEKGSIGKIDSERRIFTSRKKTKVDGGVASAVRPNAVDNGRKLTSQKGRKFACFQEFTRSRLKISG